MQKSDLENGCGAETAAISVEHARKAAAESRYEVCISGSGGQGIILIGVVLAKTALLEGKNAVQTQSYGPESRGGASRCEVVISSGEIDCPKLLGIDVLLALTAEALAKQCKQLRPGAFTIYDSVYVPTPPPGLENCLALPFKSLAVSKFQNVLVANVIALGTLVGITGVVGRDSAKKALNAHLQPKFRELNTAALEHGFAEADKFLAGK